MSLGLSPVSAATPSSERIASGERARKGRPPGTWSKQKLAPLGEWMNTSAGLAFTPHVLHVRVGEILRQKYWHLHDSDRDVYASCQLRSMCRLRQNAC
ncbi:PREDICTED: AT-hook motif nuclear-localized protein 5-like isoform X3 [Erythranthe guttata]|uniref:AT-hook motif nuclear-localized protein 5-like isoform X3 n=1 Tax=Erythranthe guttata TaxID=4155 RepID=UPI00064DE155|nr:PREDICTED: AT-hook motif nuclear-localized protein 5-like isoform X3 [Erythranthe guttata]|eukprot:XP_012857641.1 PREDICTED: AT-hook motif nuclear-localized protein 5-like isoform X3 [Erythranthe guttata]